MANADEVDALEAAKKGQVETARPSAKKTKTDKEASHQVDKSPLEDEEDEDDDDKKADSVTLSGSEHKSSKSGSSSTSSSSPSKSKKKKKAKGPKKEKQKKPKAKAKTGAKAKATEKAKAKATSGPKRCGIARKQGLLVGCVSSSYFGIQWFKVSIWYPGIPI